MTLFGTHLKRHNNSSFLEDFLKKRTLFFTKRLRCFSCFLTPRTALTNCWGTVQKSHGSFSFFIGKERPPLFLFWAFWGDFGLVEIFFVRRRVECVLRVRACTLLRARAHCVTFWEGKKQARTQVVVVVLLLQLTAAPKSTCIPMVLLHKNWKSREYIWIVLCSFQLLKSTVS